MISKRHSPLHGMGKGGAQFVGLPFDFTVKFGSWNYLINFGIRLLMFPENYAVFQIWVIFVLENEKFCDSYVLQ